ncbi:GNAT family N-acetyltransferase [Amphibacillus jilinensis]|uniref:GNAT family N-acetyltransferase n=1 Tax=Amphibacillus jilinensis TaxID=1216008 RepID=UPI0002F4FF6F|nr:GNAT family N-acetyltransferase [Amphibacillus jilinensis]
MLNWRLKSFNELDNREWYEIAKLRTDTFIVEQNCHYQDFDNYDQMSNHLFLKKGNEIVAYMRLIPSGHFYPEASFGRVIVKATERGYGYGKMMLEKGLRHLLINMGEPVIKIQAEAYLEKLYRSFGFRVISEPYLDYDIWHVDMLLEADLNVLGS